jgi:hypothetical protein
MEVTVDATPGLTTCADLATGLDMRGPQDTYHLLAIVTPQGRNCKTADSRLRRLPRIGRSHARLSRGLPDASVYVRLTTRAHHIRMSRACHGFTTTEVVRRRGW